MAHRTLIDVAAAAALVDRGAAALFDCGFDLADPAAGRRRFAARHIPGAAYLHLDEDLSARPGGADGRHPLPDRIVLAARLAALGVRRGQQVVAYDDAGGAFAARLWWLLRWLGHDAVAVLDGGLAAWTAAGLPLASGEASPPLAGDFVAGAAAGQPVASADDILASLPGRSLRVIDARAPERFRGDPNPLDPVAGHIPGAVNRFYRDNLGADGRFLPRADLARAYRALIGDTPLAQVVVYCGSGVTAAHDLLAMDHAGLGGARLYPGSWSAWIGDPARPVERG